MPKLIYVYGDDNKLLDTLVTALRAHGYSLEYANISDDMDMTNVTADIALACKMVTPSNKMTLGGLTVDMDLMSAVYENGQKVHFTPTEFAVLGYLLQNVNRAVSRDELLAAVWKFDGNSATRVADDTVKRLRRKLDDTRLRIETIWGYGFKISEVAE